VPNQWSALGGFSALSASVARGSCGTSAGPKSAMTIMPASSRKAPNVTGFDVIT
jgi:hypothetical protein